MNVIFVFNDFSNSNSLVLILPGGWCWTAQYRNDSYFVVYIDYVNLPLNNSLYTSYMIIILTNYY